MRPRSEPPGLRAQLADVYAAGVLDDVAAESPDAMRHAAADPEYAGYDDYRFMPTEWKHVHAHGSAAHVTVVGHDVWKPPGGSGWEHGAFLRRELVLAKEGGRWSLADQRASELPGHHG